VIHVSWSAFKYHKVYCLQLGTIIVGKRSLSMEGGGGEKGSERAAGWAVGGLNRHGFAFALWQKKEALLDHAIDHVDAIETNCQWHAYEHSHPACRLDRLKGQPHDQD